MLNHLAIAVALFAALGAGSAFGRWRTERAVMAAVAKARASQSDRDRDPARGPRLEKDVRDGRVVARRLVDPVTGTVTALPLDGPDPREPITPKED